MSRSTSRPFSRGRSRTIRVDAVDAAGEPIVLEVESSEWLHAKTGRYRRVWSARQTGRLAWETAPSAREALRRAAYVPAGKRPVWLAEAARRAETLR